MTFHLEPTGMGIRIALPGCGAPTNGSGESISWIVRPAADEHPRLRNNTELKDTVGRAVVKRASASQERAGRVYWSRLHREQSGSEPDQYMIELWATDDVFDHVMALAREGKPPSVALEPHGSGRVWDRDLDPQIGVKSWRAEVQVTPDEEQEPAGPLSLLDARLARMQSSIASARLAGWAAALATMLLVLLRFR